MTKIFSIIFIFSLAFSTKVFAQISNKTGISKNSQTSKAESNTRNFIQTINSNGVTVSVYNLNGFFFINDVPIGNALLTSTVNGVYYINGMPITNYVNYNNSLNNISFSNNPNWPIQASTSSFNIFSKNKTSSSTSYNGGKFVRQINANGVIASIYNLNGFFFVNDVPVGNTLSTSTSNGVYYINGMPITNYVNYYNNSLNNGSYSLNNPIWSSQSGCTVQSTDGKISTSTQCFQNSDGSNVISANSNGILSSNNGVDSATMYLQALTEFSLKDYKSALKDCNTALLSNPNHAQAIVLRTVIQSLQNEKITEEEAQNYIAGPKKISDKL